MPFTPVELLSISTQLFVAAVGLVVLGQMMTGAIATKGLLRSRPNGEGFSPTRLQLLIVTVFAVFEYIRHADFSQTDAPVLPPIDGTLFYLLLGSQAIYLTGKANAFDLIFRSLNLTK